MKAPSRLALSMCASDALLSSVESKQKSGRGSANILVKRSQGNRQADGKMVSAKRTTAALGLIRHCKRMRAAECVCTGFS